MKKVLLLRFGELYLKGKNRNIFEKKLCDNIRKSLSGENFKFENTFGRYIVSEYDEARENVMIEKMQKIFGLHSLSQAVEIDANVDTIIEEIAKIKIEPKSFRVNVNRADKNFPISSMPFAASLGEVVLQNNNCKVDLYNPQVEINVDIRMNKKAYVYYNRIMCQGGLPLGTAGRALLLLSGGIDSPVAGYLMARRGLEIDALHFHSYPYTSEQAKDKVVELAKKLSGYVGKIRLHVVSFTRIQEEIHKNCVPEYMITIMRRIMMRIAERICVRDNLGAIVTGESLGQVASQTMQSMQVTGSVVETTPVFRPCIAMDKQEIMDIAQKIDTYETSILPYEDCCTVFLPKYPVIKPSLEKALREESHLDLEGLIESAIENEEIIEV